MSPKKDDYMRGYGDGFKEALASVKVKSLEWRKTPSGAFIVHTIVGPYNIVKVEDVWAWVLIGTIASPDFSDPNAAKAAAQADYETRIRSALDLGAG